MSHDSSASAAPAILFKKYVDVRISDHEGIAAFRELCREAAKISPGEDFIWIQIQPISDEIERWTVVVTAAGIDPNV